MQAMKTILITGGTGFIGKALTRHLVEMDYPVRILLRPSQSSPSLPKGMALEAAVSSLNDQRGLQAALVDVDTIYHLASEERRGGKADLLRVDIQGTRELIKAAEKAGVRRFFYLSHLGAERGSAFPVLTAKAIAEEHIRKSSLDYTIIRSAVVFGKEDRFTTSIARLLRRIPFVFFLPDQGETLLQPLWVEDLAEALTWAVEDESLTRQTYEIGGPELLSFRDIVITIRDHLKLRRAMVSLPSPYLRFGTIFLEYIFPRSPTTIYWLDYLAANRTCSLTTLPHQFNLLPSRFKNRLEYLKP
jgi:NADH dehydrogenase